MILTDLMVDALSLFFLVVSYHYLIPFGILIQKIGNNSLKETRGISLITASYHYDIR